MEALQGNKKICKPERVKEIHCMRKHCECHKKKLKAKASEWKKAQYDTIVSKYFC